MTRTPPHGKPRNARLHRPALPLLLAVGVMLGLLASVLILSQPTAASLPEPAVGTIDATRQQASDGYDVDVSNAGIQHGVPRTLPLPKLVPTPNREPRPLPDLSETPRATPE